MEIVRLADERVEDASAMLARAFMDDPAWAWVVPSSKRRAALLPWLFRVNFEVTEAQAWTTEGGVVGCARWLPPGRPQIHVGPMLRALVATPLRAREATSRFFAYGRAVEAMRASAVPEPHWYLAGIGVDPARRRIGIGTALMQPGLDASERDHVPCALLTNNEANLSFYATRGFEVVREGRTPEEGPRAWVMRRKPSV
ncbi:MAG TPA: GNAT family N-acetyltransferase [Gaiellaceae bacterium]|nr:GNAT family N-acetyltransferase [Gaiellaceae bacterium]